MIEIDSLTKRYGDTLAVEDLSFSVSPGSILGFLGPNGAGKTTTLEIIEGLRDPTSGRTLVLGLNSQHDRAKLKERIGVQLQAGAYFDYLTLEEILDLFGSFYLKRIPPAELLEKVGLLEKRKALVRELSGGQAQRFSIVAAMVNDPDVVFLDEPTTGLDPQARRNLWELVTSINRDEGKTVVLTTHYMEEAEHLCDRVAIIDRGTIRALDTPSGLIHQLSVAYRVLFSTDRPVEPAELRALPGVAAVDASLNGRFAYELRVAQAVETLPTFFVWAAQRGVRVEDLRVLPATLEEVFLSLTGRSLRE
jgi:ABC-2 type transport system ATP-binding protein